MVGFLNAHGTSPCLFGGEFLDLSLVANDDVRTRKVSVLDLHDYTSFKEDEPFDHDFEETFWSSFLLGADYDWDDRVGDEDGDEPEESINDWLLRRYADVIQLNDELGYLRPAAEVIPFSPTFLGSSRTNVRNRHWSESKMLRDCNPHYDQRRGKAHAK